MWGRLRRILIALTVILLFPWGVVELHEHRKLSAWADQYVAPTIIFGAGVVAALGNATGTLGSFQINNGSWVDPVAQYNVSAENTTGLGAITTGTATLALNYNIHLGDGMGVAVVGAGAAGATEITTVLSGGSTSPPGTNAATLANNASTTVTNASVYAIGSIGATSNLLIVASTVGWQIGQGIDVATVGALGADLVTTVTGISSTQLALAANSVSAGTNVKINHDDTSGLSASIATGKNVNIAIGQYNITAALTLSHPQWIQCAGAVGVDVNQPLNSLVSPNPSGGTTIWNRGTINNFVNITSQQVSLRDCDFQQADDITPTAGYALQVGSGVSTTLLDGGNIERNYFSNAYGMLNVNQGVYEWNISYNTFVAGPNTAIMATVSNTQPAGDIRWIGNGFTNQGSTPLTTGACLTFNEADTDVWVWNKFNYCGYWMNITSANVNNQNFDGNSIEMSGGTTVPLVRISAGSNFNFTGNQFAGDKGQGVFSISGTASNGVIVGNIAAANISGPGYANTSSNKSSWTYAANHDPYFRSTFASAIFAPGFGLINPLTSSTSPTFTRGACVGSMGATNGTAAFAINTGTGTCTSAFTLGMPAAANGWLCNAWDPANAGTREIRETTVSTTAPVFTNYSIGTHPAATNFTASHTIRVTCSGY